MNRRALLIAATLATPAAPVVAAPAPASAAAEVDELASAAWLAGRWVGEGLGGQVEEMWSPPQDGRMIGHFSLVRGGAVVFYELLMIDARDGALRMRVKHFNRDFTAWEDRGGWHSFEPVSARPGDLRFKGLSLKRQGEEMVAVIQLRGRDGKAEEHLLRLRRAPL